MNNKLLLITNILSPYRIPVLNELSEMCGLKAVFLAENESNRKWKVYRDEVRFDCAILRNYCLMLQKKEMPVYFTWGLLAQFRQFRPDAVCVLGYHYLASVQALLYSRMMGIPCVLWSGSHMKSGFFKNRITDLYKKTVIPSFDGYVTYGRAASEMLAGYGVDPAKTVTGCNTVDVRWYSDSAEAVPEDDVSAMRSKYCRRNILYAGNLVGHKGTMDLIKAFAGLAPEDTGLVILGDGPCRGEYEKYVRDNSIRNVFFEGFRQKEDIVRYYRMADMLVLPSRNEVWGLVANEAMACSLPVIASDRTGVAGDIVKDGETGLVFKAGDSEDLAQKIKMLLGDSELALSLSAKAHELIMKRTPREYAESIHRAVQQALEKKQ